MSDSKISEAQAENTTPETTEATVNENNNAQTSKTTPEALKPPKFSASPGIFRLLGQLNTAFAFTSYQSGLLYLVGRNATGLNVHHTALRKPMGICKNAHNGLRISGGFQIYQFVNTLKPDQRANQQFDNLLIPRTIEVTGSLDAHDIGVMENSETIFVNTRFNCLAKPSKHQSFEVIWKPEFISGIVDEDRCHLNGLAMADHQPKYVTAISRSDTIDGWRDRRDNGGIVIDVETNEIIATGLSMPHSPRVYNDRLWVLNSGTGELGIINRDKAPEDSFEPKVFCPGFVRGLDFLNGYAFVGLSKPRYERFEGLALDQKLKDADSEPWCGVQIINLETMTCAEWFRIDGVLGELYDVETLPGTVCPMAVSNESGDVAGIINFDAD